MSFEQFKLNRQLLNAVDELGFTEPTEIQQKAIPRLLGGQDVIGVAQTGTGKTAAYLLPLLMRLKYAQGQNPRALILVPTKELVLQVEEDIQDLSTYLDLRYTGFYGGIGMKTQIEKIHEGLDLFVSTPGRMLDLYLKGELILKEIKYLVLDEADRMLDLGFIRQLHDILEVIPRKRQNMLFSATMHERVEKLTEDFLEFPEKIEVSPSATPAEHVDQYMYEVPNFLSKVNLLQHLLRDEAAFHRVMIFTKTKDVAENLFKFIGRKLSGEVRVLHSNKGQNARINSIRAFKEGEVRVLVATDVASRGMDITKVSHVINFEVPVMDHDYVHRIGRTGRANHKGTAITFANKAECMRLERIQALMGSEITLLDWPEGVELVETKKEERGNIEREVDRIKRKLDPTFKGAFHEKKKKDFKKKKRENLKGDWNPKSSSKRKGRKKR